MRGNQGRRAGSWSGRPPAGSGWWSINDNIVILIFTAVCFPYFSIYGKIIMEFPSLAVIMMIIKSSPTWVTMTLTQSGLPWISWRHLSARLSHWSVHVSICEFVYVIVCLTCICICVHVCLLFVFVFEFVLENLIGRRLQVRRQGDPLLALVCAQQAADIISWEEKLIKIKELGRLLIIFSEEKYMKI